MPPINKKGQPLLFSSKKIEELKKNHEFQRRRSEFFKTKSDKDKEEAEKLEALGFRFREGSEKEYKYKTFDELLHSKEYEDLKKFLNVESIDNTLIEEIYRVKNLMKKIL